MLCSAWAHRAWEISFYCRWKNVILFKMSLLYCFLLWLLSRLLWCGETRTTACPWVRQLLSYKRRPPAAGEASLRLSRGECSDSTSAQQGDAQPALLQWAATELWWEPKKAIWQAAKQSPLLAAQPTSPYTFLSPRTWHIEISFPTLTSYHVASSWLLVKPVSDFIFSCQAWLSQTITFLCILKEKRIPSVSK